MSLSCRDKHTRGHREFAALWRKQPLPPLRCSHGALDCSNLPRLSITVRRTERLRLDEAMSQAALEAQSRLPILAHRSSRQPWRITMDFTTFAVLYGGFIQSSLPDPAEPESAACHGSDPVTSHLPAESSAP